MEDQTLKKHLKKGKKDLEGAKLTGPPYLDIFRKLDQYLPRKIQLPIDKDNTMKILSFGYHEMWREINKSFVKSTPDNPVSVPPSPQISAKSMAMTVTADSEINDNEIEQQES